MKSLKSFAIGLTLVLALPHTAGAQNEYDYTPGFEPGPAAEMAPLAAMVGEWDIDIYYPMANAEAEKGWSWTKAGTTHSSITSSLGGVSVTDHFEGIPTGGSNGAEGYDMWAYETTMTWDRGAGTYRFGIVDNIWGLLDIYVGNMSATNGDVSNFETGTWGFGGAEGLRQKNRIIYSDMSEDTMTLDWWVLAEPKIMTDKPKSEQPWSPSVRLIYHRK